MPLSDQVYGHHEVYTIDICIANASLFEENFLFDLTT